MTILLIVTTLGVVIYGYVIMGRIDKFLGNRNYIDDAHEIDKSSVLLFASDYDFTFLETSLTEKRISYITTNEPNLPDNLQITMVLAISDNDLDNLLLCCKARHRFPDIFLTAKCNDVIYLSVFNETGIQRIMTGHFTEEKIISTIMEVSIS